MDVATRISENVLRYKAPVEGVPPLFAHRIPPLSARQRLRSLPCLTLQRVVQEGLVSRIASVFVGQVAGVGQAGENVLVREVASYPGPCQRRGA
jgi:hypothetical protein